MLPPKIQEYVRQLNREVTEEISPQDFRQVLLNSPAFREMAAQEVLAQLSPEERIKGLSDEELNRLIEERRKKAASDQ